MAKPYVRFRMPDGTEMEAGANAVVGRSPIASVRIDDPRVSTVHAELSWRDGGAVLLARGGRLLVGGRAQREVVLRPGIEISLVPGCALAVIAVVEGDSEAVPSTAGREALVFQIDPLRIAVVHRCYEEPALVLSGTQMRLLSMLLESPQGCPWDRAAEAVWPEDGLVRARTRLHPGQPDDWTEADERRLRNRWDQLIHQVRKLFEPIRPGMVEMRGGLAVLGLGPNDVVADPQGALRAMRNPSDQARPPDSDG